MIRAELGVGLRSVAGPALDRKGDLAAILTALEERDVLFVDEIHRLAPAVEEILYPALEDFRLDIVVGQGPSARTLALDLPPFTLVGATTRTGLLTTPLRDRFGMTFRLGYYEHDELAAIVRRSARILAVEIEDDAADEIARRSRGTPRVANRILRRVRDVAEVRHSGTITTEVAADALTLLEVDRRGARADGPGAAGSRRNEIRGWAGRALDARRRTRRGARHDRGRLRAVPAPARLPPANAAGARDHEARPRARRGGSSDRRRALLMPPDGPGIWMPGAPHPSLEDFVARLNGAIERFAKERADGQAAVEIELRDGSVHRLVSIDEEPGYGFVTLSPWRDDGQAEEMIVPVGSIAAVRLTPMEEHPPFGFTARPSKK